MATILILALTLLMIAAPLPVCGQALPALPAVPPPASAPAASGPVAPKTYITQSYVDTTVLRAIYILNEVGSYYGVGNNKQSNAVTRARAVLDDLKRKAKGDPNERYVAMKVQEVEALIFLEEEELRRIAEDKRILTANDLIRQYNGEANKFRPDFAMVRGIFRRMEEVDRRQANNIADHYNKRYRQVSQEALYSLEKALNSNDAFTAKREIEYCEKNKNYLMINGAQLAEQRRRLEKLLGAGSEMPRVLAALDAGEKAFKERRFSESRTSLVMAQNRLNEIREFLPQKDGDEAAARATRALNALDNSEDSLVMVALAMLDRQGPDAAIAYLQDVLQKQMNISSERASIVDQAIFRVRPDRELESKVKMVEADTAEDSRREYEMVLSVQEQARRRAQHKGDSVRIVRSKVSGLSNNIYTLLQNNKPKDAMRLFNKEKAFLSSAMEKGAFAMLESSVQNGDRAAAAAKAGLSKQRGKAEAQMADIYAMIEKNNIKGAYKRFRKQKKRLNKYLDGESYQMLEITVTQSYEQYKKK